MSPSKRVAVIVLARAGSSRLPGKMLLPFGTGTVLSSAIERCARMHRAQELILATTRNTADDALAKEAGRLGVRVVRGPEHDVVARMLCAVRALDQVPDVVVRACADNPLVMPSVVDQAVAELIENGCDMITPFECATYPFGFGLVVMTRECLERIDREAREPAYREHVENFCLERPQAFHVRYHVAPEALTWPELCTTLDYPVDFERLQRLAVVLEGVALEEQPAALITHLRAARVWVEGESAGAPEQCDLVLLAAQRPGLTAPGGVLVVDTFEVGDERRHGLRYAEGSPATFPHGPVFLDDHANTTKDTPAGFLARVAPLAVPHLLAAPARPIDLQEAAAPPREKRIHPGRRRGFASVLEESFPARVVLERAADDELVAALLPELERHPYTRLVRGEGVGDPFREVTVQRDGCLRVEGALGNLSSSSLAAFWRSARARAARAQLLNREGAA